LFHLGGRMFVVGISCPVDSRAQNPRRGLDVTAFRVRLAKLLMGRNLPGGKIRNQREETLATLVDIPLAQALDRQAITEK
jgi:hypothetical protein